MLFSAVHSPPVGDGRQAGEMPRCTHHIHLVKPKSPPPPSLVPRSADNRESFVPTDGSFALHTHMHAHTHTHTHTHTGTHVHTRACTHAHTLAKLHRASVTSRAAVPHTLGLAGQCGEPRWVASGTWRAQRRTQPGRRSRRARSWRAATARACRTRGHARPAARAARVVRTHACRIRARATVGVRRRQPIGCRAAVARRMPSAGGRQSSAGRLARHWNGTGTAKKCRRTDRHAVRRLSEYSRAASKSARALSRTFTQPECGAARANVGAALRRCAAAPKTMRCHAARAA